MVLLGYPFHKNLHYTQISLQGPQLHPPLLRVRVSLLIIPFDRLDCFLSFELSPSFIYNTGQSSLQNHPIEFWKEFNHFIQCSPTQIHSQESNSNLKQRILSQKDISTCSIYLHNVSTTLELQRIQIQLVMNVFLISAKNPSKPRFFFSNTFLVSSHLYDYSTISIL